MRKLIVALLVVLAGVSHAFGDDSASSDGRNSGDRKEHSPSVPKVIDASGKVVGPVVYFEKGREKAESF